MVQTDESHILTLKAEIKFFIILSHIIWEDDNSVTKERWGCMSKNNSAYCWLTWLVMGIYDSGDQSVQPIRVQPKRSKISEISTSFPKGLNVAQASQFCLCSYYRTLSTGYKATTHNIIETPNTISEFICYNCIC
ncbi:hypothetical protein H5410_036974 [Solanum commersonii]|uniref:Uncharacterized protein n=1 Tax=Solanum commersonii TaxID=4109 RepID=A0A9J5Y9U2_SOLCO|nr:hypothetical protein H5410_036974 [Solanum commersonii]